jgi:hypothetical protein
MRIRNEALQEAIAKCEERAVWLEKNIGAEAARGATDCMVALQELLERA